MPEKADLSYAFGLTPEKAVEYFKGKGYAFSFDWYDTWQEAHAKAFTVAKAMRADILEDIRGSVQKALDSGQTLEEFRKGLEPTLKAKGWWGKVAAKDVPGYDPATGGPPDKMVQLGSPYRLQTIYQTNLQTAYMAGRYKEMMENVDDRPYWMYVAVMDNKTRPAHAALHGKVFRYDDPFWDTFYPPLGFRCRCRVRALDQRYVDKNKIDVSTSEGQMSWEDKLVSKSTGELQPVSVYTDPFTGEKIATDVGWSYNPGKAAWQPDLDKYPQDVARQYMNGAVTGPDFKRFFDGETAGNFPVAVIDQPLIEAIDSKSQVVYLSSETLAKNTDRHPEIGLADYQSLPGIIQDAQLIVQDGDNTFVFFRSGDTVYFGAVKTTASGETNFLTSLRIARQSDIDSIKRKGKVLKNEL